MSESAAEVIFPPKYVRTIIDKTAQFVAKNGDQFEQRIRAEQGEGAAGSAAKFAFLNPNNAYHAYYRLKLTELKSGIDVEIKPSIPQAILDRRKKLELKNEFKERLLALTDFGASGADDEIDEPEKDAFTFTQPFVAAMDMDIIKATATFVARNGQRFLVELAKREKSNPQFDFLSPSHCLFGFFTSLTESYTKCLLPTKPQIEKLNTVAKDKVAYLRKCQKRADWDARQQAKTASEEMRKAEERMEMQSIDWHTFFIAETITFTPVGCQMPSKITVLLQNEEGLPPPIDFTQPGAAMLLMTRNPRTAATERNSGEQLTSVIPLDADQINPEVAVVVDDEEEKTEDPSTADITAPEPQEADNAVAVETVPTVSKFSDAPESYKRRVARDNDVSIDGDEIIKVKKSYTRKSKAQTAVEMQRCPITGQMIPATEMSAHLKILLLDPKWKHQKERFIEKAMKESAFAPLEGNLRVNSPNYVQTSRGTLHHSWRAGPTFLVRQTTR
ncbi:Surp module domain containing protein, putative [Babesia bigemina]|uniref:Surp module domain containing protein, putative n=1 Tax=Babesia bigemina TaxID=5866 RepID=A0A061DAI1_BABBI|nr:Surp module domain containing protein, putative [Babesia bigemina]CDR96987.1 Surp module domain containing protein, putative [Babesia bigemina]|eukprot:XP_012769173.1 Surp module domain containing protein, putative [Babesia bigemina]